MHMPPSANMIESLPHRRLEAWKWTDVRGHVSETSKGLSAAGAPLITPPEGIHIGQGDGHPGDTPMGQMAVKFAGPSWQIFVPENGRPATPLVIENIAKGHTRLAIMVDAGGALEMVEHYRGDAGGFSNFDIQIHLGKGASLTRTIVHDDPDSHVRVVTACIAAEEGAKINQYALSFGGALSRLETRLYGEGENIEATINGAYLLNDKRHCDMTSHIDLQSPNCVIRQAVKGVVTDNARGVFQGKFKVARKAQHTDAEMRHDALMLSETSEIRSKPELEIYADDVACAHGNTIGQLDDSALFYMRQRGISKDEAKALLTEAFLGDVFDDISDEAMKESLLTKIREWLGRNS